MSEDHVSQAEALEHSGYEVYVDGEYPERWYPERRPSTAGASDRMWMLKNGISIGKETKPTRGSKVTIACKCCGHYREVRKADVKRGWGKYCSKSCKAYFQSYGKKR